VSARVSAPAPDARAAAALLARAFAADPLFAWVAPDPRTRARALPAVFRGALRHCRRHGGVVATAAGVAGWVPLEHLSLGAADLLRSGLPVAALRLGAAGTRRLHAHESACDERTLAVAPPRSAYLWMVGVEPGQVGRGDGRRLVTSVAAEAAAAGFRHLLLKTEHPPNVALYEHLGFSRAATVIAPGGGPDCWVLLRALPAA
jgi:ribosomal protein S18 acetylase RimI-like enzyme